MPRSEALIKAQKKYNATHKVKDTRKRASPEYNAYHRKYYYESGKREMMKEKHYVEGTILFVRRLFVNI